MSEPTARGASPQQGHTDESAVDAIGGILSVLEGPQDRNPREQSKSAKKRSAAASDDAAPPSPRRTVTVPDLDEDEDEREDEDDDLESDESEDDEEESERLDDDEDEDDADETDDEEDDVDVAPITLEIEGEKVEVTFDELKSGYLRQSDYTRKTQALAAERKKLQSEELPALRAERQQYATLLSQLTEAVESYSPGEPDWEAIKRDRPNDLANEMLEWQQYQNSVNQLKAQKAAALQQAIEDQRAAIREQVAEEREKLLMALPEWKKPEVAKREKAELVKYAVDSLGFTEEEMSSVMDHRALIVLRKAMLHDRAEADRKTARKVAREKIERATKVARPGAPARQRERMPDARKALLKARRSGRDDDAVEAIMHLL